MTELTLQEDRPNGPVAAALLAGGLGAAALGLLTTISENCKPMGDALNWWKPAGALTGKAGLAVAVFFISWVVLHFVFRGKNITFGRVAVLAVILLGIGLLGTFPPFFELFAAH